MPSRPHEHTLDLDTLISKINDFLSLPIPETPKECEDLYFGEGRNLLGNLQQQYLRTAIKIDLAKDKISPEFKPTGEMTAFQRIELPQLHSRLQTRLLELSDKAGTKIPLEGESTTKPYLEPTKKPFQKEWKEPLIKMKAFMANSRVRAILKKFEKTEDQTFVLSTLEPLIYRKVTLTDSDGDTEIESVRTLMRSVTSTNSNTSKPGPKDAEGINEILILLAIHFKKWLEKEHYRWIADLLNLCPEICGGRKWTEGSIKNKFLRLKKSNEWSQKFEYYLPNWKEYYPHQPSPSDREGWYILPRWEVFYLDRYSHYNQDARDSGLSQLVRRLVR